jgi:hypothetical protein
MLTVHIVVRLLMSISIFYMIIHDLKKIEKCIIKIDQFHCENRKKYQINKLNHNNQHIHKLTFLLQIVYNSIIFFS